MAGAQGLALRALAAVGVALMLFIAGMWVGHDVATTQADARQARAATAELKRLSQAVAQGVADAEALREQLRLQGRYTATLTERARHAAPLAVVQPRLATADAGLACASPLTGPVPPIDTEAAAPAPAAPGAQQPGVVLSLAAVSLWDSALAGHDVGAGACRADDPAGAACAAGSGLELEDAWANHRINAASCAADRARLDALISHLERRDRTRQQP